MNDYKATEKRQYKASINPGIRDKLYDFFFLNWFTLQQNFN